ncbi:hypothetical protein WVIC16_50010 [Weissella viridescens]|nr:hypothetical protein WVIC16_50010 [Weissella viridescens]
MTLNNQKYEFTAEIHESQVDKDDAYVIFPYNGVRNSATLKPLTVVFVTTSRHATLHPQ